MQAFLAGLDPQIVLVVGALVGDGRPHHRRAAWKMDLPRRNGTVHLLPIHSCSPGHNDHCRGCSHWCC